MHNIVLEAEVTDMALSFSPSSIEFLQMNGPRYEELEESRQTLICQNLFPLELHGSLEVKLPFRLSRTEFTLLPMEVMRLDVCLDWQQPKDKLSHCFGDKIGIHYRDTPKKDYVLVTAEVHFPNLEIEANKVEFG
jgi:hypothetical protein